MSKAREYGVITYISRQAAADDAVVEATARMVADLNAQEHGFTITGPISWETYEPNLPTFTLDDGTEVDQSDMLALCVTVPTDDTGKATA